MFKHVASLLIGCIIFFQFYACSNRPDGVMSQRKMKAFLTEIHLLDGVLSTQVIENDRERAYYYNALFEKHGTSKAAFDSSLVYYTKNPKVFERIYAGVVKNLEALKSDVDGGKYFPVLPDSIRLKPTKLDIWSQPLAFKLPEDSVKNNAVFSISHRALLTKDIYHLHFLLRVAPQDSIEHDAYAALRIHYANGQVDSLTHPISTDSVLRRYKFRMKASRNFTIDSLTGAFFNDWNKSKKLKISVDSISLNREYIVALQDSLRLQLDSVSVIVMDVDSIAAAQKPDSIQKKEETIEAEADPQPIKPLKPSHKQIQKMENR